MEFYLTIRANFDESGKETLTSLIERLKKRRKKADLEVANDKSISDRCYQLHHPQALEVARYFISHVSLLLGKEWEVGEGKNIEAIKEMVRGISEIFENKGDMYLKLLVSGYDRNIIKLLLPLLADLGANSVSATGVGDEEFEKYEHFEYKDGELHYQIKER
jgi:hypothetical protein